MKCFNHEIQESVGFCKHCHKALCRECAINTNFGLTCKGQCEQEQKDVNELIEFNKSRLKRFKKIGGFYQIAIYILIAFSVVYFLQYIKKDIRRTSENNYSSKESLYEKIELGAINTFGMDTTILNTRKIYFNYDINEFTSAWLIKLLWLLDSKSDKPIDLYICSGGGFISEAKAIGNTIRALGAKVNTFATGHCASSALRIVAYGTGCRASYCNTILMFHGADYSDDKIGYSYDAIARGIDTKDWQRISKISREMVSDTTEINMTPDKVLELGFIDTVICQ